LGNSNAYLILEVLLYCLICSYLISFFKGGEISEAEMRVKDWKAKSRKFYPDAVFLNPGVHMRGRKIEENRAALVSFIKTTDSIASTSFPTKYFVHSISPVKPPECTWNMTQFDNFYKIVKELAPTWRKLAAFLDYYDYGKKLDYMSGTTDNCRNFKGISAGSLVPPCTCKRNDGIHYDRVCNYGPLMSQWDFNWLLAENLISYKPPVEKL